MPGVTYDTGALIAAERGDQRMLDLHEGYLAQGVTPVVPAVVLAQAWRGDPRQAPLFRVLKRCEVEPMTKDHAKAVGELLRRAQFDDIVDASVVVGAVERGDVVVTSDAAHIARLADALEADIDIVAV